VSNSLVTIEIEYDYEAEAFVTCVKELTSAALAKPGELVRAD
jgi:hypothetical protein